MLIGYVPYSDDFRHPADRRRVLFYTKFFNHELQIADINCSYDIVILSEKADLTLWINYNKSKLILDLCDGYLLTNFFNYKNLLKGYISFILGISHKPYFNYKSLIKKFCKEKASAIICSSQEQMNSIYPLNINVFNINDSHSGEIININKKKDCQKLDIFWEGMGVSLNNLKLLRNIDKSLLKKINFHIVSDLNYFKFFNRFVKKDAIKEIEKLNITYNLYEWNYDNLNKISNNCDIAIIPLNKNAMNKGRSLNKLLLMHRLGLVTLCSDIESYNTYLNKNGMGDLIFKTKSEFINKIKFFVSNKKIIQNYKVKLDRAILPYSDKNTSLKWNSAINSCRNEK